MVRLDYYFKPILTGPRVFAKVVKPEMPWQLVIRLDDDQYRKLLPLSAEFKYNATDALSWIHTIVIGKLQLICCLNDDDFERWRNLTKQLIQEAPVSRKRACEVAEEIFA